MKRGHVNGFGRQIGVGKESDVFLVLSPVKEGEEIEEKKEEEDGVEKIIIDKSLAKLEELDDEEDDIYDLEHKSKQSSSKNPSFQDVKEVKQLIGYIRVDLSALKEYAFMKAIYDTGVYSSYPLYQVKEMKHPRYVFRQCIDLIVKLAQYGLVHGDFNEFNLLIKPMSEKIVVIDFPQMISTSHPNAEFYFDRDIICIHTFFEKRFSYIIKPDDEEYDIYFPKLSEIKKEHSLDVHVEASGFTAEKSKEFDEIMKEKEEEDNFESNNEEVVDNNEENKEEELKLEEELIGSDNEEYIFVTSSFNLYNNAGIKGLEYGLTS
ncbi:hypothetical protein ABK040_012802 [Willaertia magna]